ncbi:uncharacterized protein isoform X1 [Choristoneura fumiferana]|uniref:uncharacterized protein isoform X1 n=1 Tax=Choristoneura fumiferana TaxID=7141 RepID=UPI003D15D0B9
MTLKNAIYTTADSVTVVINDNSESESTNLQPNVTLNIIDEKQFEDIETIETTTDDTFERTTYIEKMFESEDIVSYIPGYLPSTINLDAFEGNGSIFTTYSYTLETTDIYDKYNNSELNDKDYFDVNNTITTELTTESESNSFTQIINEQTHKENYSTETKDDIVIEVLVPKNAPVEVVNYEARATAVIPHIDNIDISDTLDTNEISDGTTYRVSEIFKTSEESLALETKYLLDVETFDTNDTINKVYASDKVRNIINTTDANIFEAIVERVETLLKAETSDVTDLLLQNTETPIVNKASESTIDMNDPLKVLPLINNATNAMGNTVDYTTDGNVTAKSVTNSFEGYLPATETIFNDE